MALSARFERYEVRFDQLEQGPETPVAARRALDPSRLHAFAFVASAASQSVDFWIDDVEWIEKR